MIAQIRGTVIEKHPTRIIVDVGGIGYEIWISLSSYDKIGHVGETVTLQTYMHVREDIMHLYGFVALEEKDLFLLLISVSGVGPKSALGILSSFTAADLRHAIAHENVDYLTAAPGVGKKTAQRIVVDLKEKVSKMVGTTEVQAVTPPSVTGLTDEALIALTSLGFARAVADKAVAKALREHREGVPSLEALIKTALRIATNG